MEISKEVKVGLLATSALVIMYLGFNFLKGRETFASTNIYCTTYATSAGLGSSSPVIVNGMTVGKVKSIRILPEQGYSALVTFAVEKSITLTDATQARLVSRSLWGEKAIDLLIKPGAPLNTHDAVPGEVEQSLGEAFSKNAVPTLNDAKDASKLAGQFLASMVENAHRINGVLANLEATAQELRQTVKVNQEGVSQVTKNLTTFSGVLADSESGIGPLLVKLNQLMEGLEGGEAQIAAKKLNSILGSLEQLLDKTETGKNSLSKLLHDDALYNNLSQTLVTFDQLLFDLRAHPWRYVNFSVFGPKKSRESRQKD